MSFSRCVVAAVVQLVLVVQRWDQVAAALVEGMEERAVVMVEEEMEVAVAMAVEED